MTLEEFKTQALGIKAQEMSQEQIEMAYSKFVKLFNVLFEKYKKTRSHITLINQVKK